MIKLSVLIPTYNRADSLDRTLKSLSSQTYDEKFLCLISDNKSTDNTKDILKDLLINNRDLFVSNIEDKKRGYANAIRSSVKIAKGKYILNVDSDGQCDPKDFINSEERLNQIYVERGKQLQKNSERQAQILETQLEELRTAAQAEGDQRRRGRIGILLSKAI